MFLLLILYLVFWYENLLLRMAYYNTHNNMELANYFRLDLILWINNTLIRLLHIRL